jgi:hypothetical protein
MCRPPAEFQAAGLNLLYLAWQIAIGAVQAYDGAIAGALRAIARHTTNIGAALSRRSPTPTA